MLFYRRVMDEGSSEVASAGGKSSRIFLSILPLRIQILSSLKPLMQKTIE